MAQQPHESCVIRVILLSHNYYMIVVSREGMRRSCPLGWSATAEPPAQSTASCSTAAAHNQQRRPRSAQTPTSAGTPPTHTRSGSRSSSPVFSPAQTLPLAIAKGGAAKEAPPVPPVRSSVSEVEDLLGRFVTEALSPPLAPAVEPANSLPGDGEATAELRRQVEQLSASKQLAVQSARRERSTRAAAERRVGGLRDELEAARHGEGEAQAQLAEQVRAMALAATATARVR
jgi:hypothetical protein